MGKYGWRNNKLTAKELVIDGNMTFGDAAADTLTVTGTATFATATTFSSTIAVTGVGTISGGIVIDGADKTIDFTGTNTEATPAFSFLDDTYMADADGALGATAGFIVVDIGGTNYKVQTYAMS